MKTTCSPFSGFVRTSSGLAVYIASVIAALAGSTASAATLYVWQNSPSPAAPYTDWATAVHVIQDAVDAAADGDTVRVAGGVYSTDGRAVSGPLTNRVAIDRAISVESLMGPEVTVIRGAAGIRCAYVGTNAILSGFTLTNGTLTITNSPSAGGGAWCEDSATLSNCIVAGNSALNGGGVYGGAIYNCIVIGNVAYGITLGWRYHLGGNGGGSAWSRLYNCTLAHNQAEVGGGAFEGTLYNCTLTENGASVGGGGSCQGVLYNCTLTRNGSGCMGDTLYNCIVYFNSGVNYAPYYVNIDHGYYVPTTFYYSCTTPLPTEGTNNIDADPQMITLTHLSASSPLLRVRTF